MTKKELIDKFSQGIKWNAILFGTYKIISIISTILLFKKLTTEDFSLWANVFSAIYLILLWLDFGFRKSLPLYCPQFAKNSKFLEYIIIFQATVLLIFTTIFIIFSQYITNKLNILDKTAIFYLGTAIFFTEGLLAIFKLIYHSYFRQKQFNSLMSIIVIFKSIILFFFILVIKESFVLLKFAFILELLASILSIAVSIKPLKALHSQHNHIKHKVTHKNLTAEFVFHSGVLWVNTSLKSLSERNFITLFFTYLLGPVQANLFKIVNDSALLLQRITVKTIGTTDTSLLFHAQTIEHEKTHDFQKTLGNNFLQVAFENLITQISKICIPIFGIIIFLAINFNYLLSDTQKLSKFGPSLFCQNLFCLIITFYLFESILSPYERLLEIKRKYIPLTLSYLPYVLTMASLIFFKFTVTWGIFLTILFIQISRLLIYITMAIYVRQKYKFYFPVKKVAKIILLTLTVFILATIIIKTLVFSEQNLL